MLLFGKVFQELCNIPFAATTACERTRPIGNGIHVITLFEQALNVALSGTAAMAHDAVCRIDILRVHGFYSYRFFIQSYCNIGLATILDFSH